ncbi:MAG TPA: isoprenylcysteine carboxylmethyltransferase family protein [Caulobacteraceae bacterium]
MKISPRLAAFSVFSVLIYLGIAVLGAGGFVRFFADPARAALAITTLVLAGASLFTAVNLSSGQREDRGNRWVLAALGVIGILSAYLPAYTERVGFWVLGGATVSWVGVALYAAGGALRMWPVFVLGRRFSGLVAIQPDHTLVTGGVYSVIRHPSYLGLIIIGLGWGLAFRSGVGVLLGVLNILPVLARIEAEETLLSSQFGAEYEAFRHRTARLIPGLY